MERQKVVLFIILVCLLVALFFVSAVLVGEAADLRDDALVASERPSAKISIEVVPPDEVQDAVE